MSKEEQEGVRKEQKHDQNGFYLKAAYDFVCLFVWDGGLTM